MPEIPLLKTAKKLIENGFSPIPCHNHPKKSPAIASWTDLQQKPMTAQEAEKHFNNGGSIGVICGTVSGNLECMDFDDPELYQPFMDTLQEVNPNLTTKLVKRQTPSGGFHLIYRCKTKVLGNQKLAVADDKGEGKTLIETRGEGGYFLSAPSTGYTIIEHSLLNVPVLTADEVDLLHSISKSFSEKVEPRSEPKELRAEIDGTRPGDDYNQRADFRQLLIDNGWTTTERIGPGGEHWTRPGKKDGTSATLKDGSFYVFSSNAGLPLGSQSAFSVYAYYQHNGDFSEAARELARQGYGQKEATVQMQPIGRLLGEDGEQDVIDPADPHSNAQKFVKKYYHTDAIRTLQFWQSGFYAWAGSAYTLKQLDDIRAALYDYLKDCFVEKKEEREPFKPNRHKVNDLLDALKAVANLAGEYNPPCWLEDADKPNAVELIACNNGLLHLPTRTLYESNPTFFTTSALPFDYDPNAKEPLHLFEFLKSLWPEDPASIEALQEIAGYFLTFDTTQQKIFLFVGPKRSGKGTIARILRALLGNTNVAGPTLASLSQQFGLASLIGKRLAVIADARLGAKTNQHTIAERLLSISGEDCLSIPRKYLPDYTAQLDTRFIIMTNELPRIADASGALASRFIILSMTKSFLGKEDPALTSKLLAELPGILNWAIDGWQRLMQRGYFIQPESSNELIEELADLTSPISAFVRDCCVIDPASEIEISRLYVEWEDWSEKQGRKFHGTVQTFGRDLRAAVPDIRTTQTRQGNERVRCYKGITLISTWHAVSRESKHCTRK